MLGPIYQTGVANGLAGPLTNTVSLLTRAYSFDSSDLGVAKFYFANGTTNGTTTAVAATGNTIPTFNGLPSRTNSVYDAAYGVTNTSPGQDIYGSSRPVQVSPTGINQFDSTSIAGLTTNPSFPSGHTTYAYTDSLLIAMLVPQDYQAMLSRGSDYANSRIVLGVHYPLDIIASRALAAYDLSQAFTNAAYISNAATTGTAINLPGLFTAASPEIQSYLAAQCGSSVATCSTSAANTANDPYVASAANQALYTSRLTYGLPTLTLAQAPQEAAPTGGPDASFLLAPIYGGDTTAAKTLAPTGGLQGTLATSTINQIIVNTETVALAAFYGTNLSYWTRINLYAASGYFQGVTGTVSLAATDVLTTNVTIAATGTVEANGTITGTTNVTSGGTLAGNGTVGAVTIASGGTLAPGSLATMGTLTIVGPLSFAAGSTYNVRATATQADRTNVTGTAALNGTVAVQAGGTFMPQTRYTILTASGGVTGTFANVTSNFAFLTPTLSYDANDSYLTLSRNNVQFAAAAATPNQRAVAQSLTLVGSQPTTAAGGAILNSLFALSTAGAQAAFDQLSGEGLAGAQTANIRAGRAFSAGVSDQLSLWRGTNAETPVRELADLPSIASAPAFLPQPARARMWASGFGGGLTVNANAARGITGQTADFFGGTVGADYEVQPGFLLGGALGGSGSDFNVASRTTTGSASGFHAALYGAYGVGSSYIQSTTSFARFSNATTRFVGGFGGFGTADERASFSSNEIRERLEAGRALSFDGGAYGTPLVRVTPFAALEIARLATDGFAEYNTNGVGNLLALRSSGQTTADVPGFLGVRLDGVTNFGGVALRPVLSLAYVHDFATQRNLTNGLISLPGSTFLVQGARAARDAAQVKLGAEAAISRNMSLFANFDGEFSGAETVYGGKGGLRISW